MNLRPYQEAGRDFLAARRHAYLADEMRVGKTPQAILAARKVQARSAIVVCPAIAVAHWRAEWRKWWPDCGFEPLVVSYERLRLDAATIFHGFYDVAIVDEAHFAKNPEAQRTKLVFGKGGLGWRSHRMWALSGTPAPKNAAELWPVMFAFGATSMPYAEFVATFCYSNADGRILGTKQRQVPELRQALSKILLRRTRREVAPEMPEIAFEFLEVTPTSPADLRLPENCSDADLLAWLEAQPAAADDRVAVALGKVEPLVEEIVESIRGGLYAQTVVFGWHVEPLEQLAARLRANRIETRVLNGATPAAQRAGIQEAFREGRLQVIAANIAAAGTAIDLSAASHGYFLEMDWTPGSNAQAANRLVSMAKKEPVTYDIVTWPGSMDDAVQRVLLRRVKELAKLY